MSWEPWMQSAARKALNPGVVEAIEERAIGDVPMIFGERTPPSMSMRDEDDTRCPGCGQTARSYSRHTPKCPELLPGHAEEDEDE